MTLSATCGLLTRRIEGGHRPEGRGPGVVAQDRDVAAGQFVGERGAVGGVGQVHGTHLDRNAVALREPGGEIGQHLTPARRDDQAVAARGEFGGECFADTLRGPGDDGTGIRAGWGYWHAAMVNTRLTARVPGMTQPAEALPAPKRSRVAAWALWDCGFVGMYAIVVTFVFSVYLTESVGEGTPGGASPASWLGRALAIAGLTVAVFAPIIGVWVQAPALRRRALTVLTAAAVLLTASMSLVRDEPSYLFLGLALLAVDRSVRRSRRRAVQRNAQTTVDAGTSGRISGIGSAAGYLGSVMLLAIVYFGFVMGDGQTRGLLGVSVDDGYNVRVVMVVTALWFAMLALPLLFTAHHILPPDATAQVPVSALGAYRQLWSDISAEWRRDRNLVYYLVASAIFRDGLVGVFTFGAVLGVSVYGISQADVLIFGVAVSVVAAVGAVLGGHVDDRIGSKAVIVGSLTAMIAVSLHCWHCPARWRSGRAAWCCVPFSARRRPPRGRCCCDCRPTGGKGWRSASTP